MSLPLTAYLEALNVASGSGANATRATGGTHDCPVCRQPVAVLEDRTSRLTSSGRAWEWRRRAAWAHNTLCYAAYKQKIAADTAAMLEQVGDLWNVAGAQL